MVALTDFDLQSRMSMNQMLTQDWWPKPETCSLGCWLNQPLTQPWLRECHAHSSNMHQRLTQLKSEIASFPHASATDSINIRDCKFLAPATNLASASDSSTSETASLQHPAAASSTAASNLLRATKKLSYGSSLVKQEYFHSYCLFSFGCHILQVKL